MVQPWFSGDVDILGIVLQILNKIGFYIKKKKKTSPKLKNHGPQCSCAVCSASKACFEDFTGQCESAHCCLCSVQHLKNRFDIARLNHVVDLMCFRNKVQSQPLCLDCGFVYPSLNGMPRRSPVGVWKTESWTQHAR